jgi:gluconate 2-dehydrogenase gamma chain
MTRPFAVNRREFIVEVVWASMGASLVLVGGCQAHREATPATPSDAGAPKPPPAAPGHFFNALELATLTAACERILPRDDEPGATDLGVPAYVDRILTDDIMVNWREPLRRGLADLEERARQRGGASFTALADVAQDELMAEMETATRGPTGFFARLMRLTFEGAFGDPRHGGNRDGLGWKLLGFTPDVCAPATLAQIGRKK